MSFETIPAENLRLWHQLGIYSAAITELRHRHAPANAGPHPYEVEVDVVDEEGRRSRLRFAYGEPVTIRSPLVEYGEVEFHRLRP